MPVAAERGRCGGRCACACGGGARARAGAVRVRVRVEARVREAELPGCAGSPSSSDGAATPPRLLPLTRDPPSFQTIMDSGKQKGKGDALDEIC